MLGAEFKDVIDDPEETKILPAKYGVNSGLKCVIWNIFM